MDAFKGRGPKLNRETINTGSITQSNFLSAVAGSRIPTEKLQNTFTQIARYQGAYIEEQEKNRIIDKNQKYSVLLTEESREWAENQKSKSFFGEEPENQYDKNWNDYKTNILKKYKRDFYKDDDKAWEKGEVVLKDVLNRTANIHYQNRNKKQNANTITNLVEGKRIIIDELGKMKGNSKIAYKNYILKLLPNLAKRGAEVGYNYDLEEYRSIFLQKYYQSHLLDDYSEDDELIGTKIDYDQAIEDLRETDKEKIKPYYKDLTDEQKLEIQKTYIAFNKKQKERLTSLTDARNDKLFEKYFDQVIRFDPLNPDQYVDPNEISNAKFIGKKGIELKKQLLELHTKYFTKKIKTNPAAYNKTLEQILDGTTRDLISKNIVIDGERYSVITNPFISADDKVFFKELIEKDVADESSTKAYKDAVTKFNSQVKEYEVNLRGSLDIASDTIFATQNYISYINLKLIEIQKKMKDGINPDDFFNPSSKDYLFRDINNYVPSRNLQQEWLKDSVNSADQSKIEDVSFPKPSQKAIELLQSDDEKYKNDFIEKYGINTYEKHRKK
jgi:hypothetical protein|tara:strand:- start:4587 stop:6257 length:1671 start_codon:yes stop_codon:yes gene_type:complete